MPADRIAITAEISPRDVALRLYEQGFVPATLPRRDEDLTVAILRAFEQRADEQTRVRFGALPATRVAFVEIRKHLDLITREAERLGRSLECERYRPAFMPPLKRG